MTSGPRIDLLGRDHVRQMTRRQSLLRQSAAAICIGAVMALAAVAWQYRHLLELRERHAREAQDLARSEKHASQAASLQLALQALAKRHASLQTLAQQQGAGAQALVELASHFPPGLRLTQWQQEADTLVLTGTAISGERLAALIAAWSVPGRAWGSPESVSWTSAPGSTAPASARSNEALPAVLFSLRLTRQAGVLP